MSSPRSSCTHIFQAAHEVVADRGAWQVSCVEAAPDVEKIIRAQHGVILLSVARGGQYPIHQDRHLEDASGRQDKTWKDSKSNRKNWPNYFMLHFVIVVEFALMLNLESNYKNRFEGFTNLS